MADEKEVTVKIMTEVDDNDVSDLEDRLEELNNNEVDVAVTSDSSEVDNVESSVEDLETEIENVNNTTVSPAGDSSGVDSVSESVNGLNDALVAVGAGVSLGSMEQLVTTASNINDSWNRLGLTFGGVSGQMKTDIAEAGESTGRSGGLIRQYFNDMGIAGVTNTELLQQSFEALSGRAYQTGNSIESMEQKMKMIVMSGNVGARQLTQLGISTADLGRVMGVSADEASKMFKTLSQEERLRVLTQAMGDGKNANEMYKNSWQGLKDQVNKATGALMGAVGNMILPFLIPAMQLATQTIEALSAGFKALPTPIQSVIGGVLAVVMGFLALTTVIGTISAVANAINLIQTAMNIWNAVTRVATVVQAALNAVMMMNPYVLLAVAIIALIAALVYLYTTCEPVRNAIDGFGQALWGLGEAIYGGIAGAIQWLIDGFTWLYTTIIGLFTSTSGEGINWLTTMIMVMMGPIAWILLLIQHWNQIAPAVSNALSGMYNAAVTWFAQTMSHTIAFGANLVSNIGSAASNAVSAFGSGLSGLVAEAWAEFNDVLQAIYDFGAQAIAAAQGIGQQIVQALWNRHSPGIMAQATFLETKDSKMFLEHGLADMVDITRHGSDNIMVAYNPNLNTNVNGTGGNGGNGGVVNNFSFTFTGFINDEERLTDLIIRTITDEINWNNDTANRTV